METYIYSVPLTKHTFLLGIIDLNKGINTKLKVFSRCNNFIVFMVSCTCIRLVFCFYFCNIFHFCACIKKKYVCIHFFSTDNSIFSFNRLKIETLQRCEDVLQKLYSKVEKVDIFLPIT